MSRNIPLSSGGYTIVDDDDYDSLINSGTWNLNSGYVSRATTTSGENGKRKSLRIFMHKHIMNCPKGFVVDHINGNKLDNRKINLRICTTEQNNLNKRKTSTKSLSNYKGISLHPSSKRWMCRISFENNVVFNAYFTNEIAAANAYNYYAKEYHGEFAKLNEVAFMEKEEWEKFIAKRNANTYKYIIWDKEESKWKCSFILNGKRIFVGRFDSELDAVLAFNSKCLELNLIGKIQEVIKND